MGRAFTGVLGTFYAPNNQVGGAPVGAPIGILGRLPTTGVGVAPLARGGQSKAPWAPINSWPSVLDFLPPAARATVNGAIKDLNDQGECEVVHRLDTDECNKVTRRRGSRAGAVCHGTASQRYSECLTRGPGNVTTPLYNP